jgi:hypothetical protein
MNHDHNSHIIDSYIAELGLQARDRRREPQPALELAPTQSVAALSVLAAPLDHRNYTDPRLVVRRVRGDRPTRFTPVRSDVGQPCLGL